MFYDILKVLATGVITSIITIVVTNNVQRKSLKKETKREFVRKVYGYRYQLGSDRKEQSTEWEINFLLGQVPIMFSDNKSVLSAYRKLINERTDENLYVFLLELCRDADVSIDTAEWDKETVIRYIRVI